MNLIPLVAVDKFLNDGYFFGRERYCLFEKYYQIMPSLLEDAKRVCTDGSYKNGKRFLTHSLEEVPQGLNDGYLYLIKKYSIRTEKDTFLVF